MEHASSTTASSYLGTYLGRTHLGAHPWGGSPVGPNGLFGPAVATFSRDDLPKRGPFMEEPRLRGFQAGDRVIQKRSILALFLAYSRYLVPSGTMRDLGYLG